MTKDPKRVEAGKRAWAKLSPAKKAAVRARLKRIRPKTKGGGGSKAVAKRPAEPGGGGGTAVTTKAKPPRIGASYSAGKSTVFLLAPVTDSALAELGSQRGIRGDALVIVQQARSKVWSLDYAYNVGVVAADEAIDKVTAHKQALSGGSVTAWAPEGFLWVTVAAAAAGGGTGQQRAREAHRFLVQTHQGYDPTTGKMQIGNPAFRTYRAMRHGGQIVRRAKNRSRIVGKILRPVARVLKAFGLRI